MLQPCLHYDCNNRNNAGFCNTTMCINPRYSKIGSAQYGQGVQKQIVSNADIIRNMADEELASKFADIYCPDGLSVNHERCKQNYLKGQPIEVCEECWLEWLKQEATNVG